MGRNLTLARASALPHCAGIVTEWMVHPGYPTAIGDSFSQSEERRIELDFITSNEFHAWLKQNDLALITFSWWAPHGSKAVGLSSNPNL
jgi:predicted glycoside hydrolase/deacetylase ChbG (UPF0249 family)